MSSQAQATRNTITLKVEALLPGPLHREPPMRHNHRIAGASSS